MKKSLPARPNLDHLRTQAKQLMSALRAGHGGAARTFIEHLPAAKRMTPKQVLNAGFRLADAQSAIARKSGFTAWPSLARHVEQLRAWEGEWRFVSLEVDGRAMPGPMSAQSRMLIDGDRFRMESPEAAYEGTFSIDVEPDPAQIDIEFVEGPEAGQWSYGIYRFDGRDIVMCLGLTGAPRPTRFTTTAGSGHALERLRRASSARPPNVTGGRRKSPTAAASPPAPASTPATGDEAAFALTMTPLLEQIQGEWAPVSLITDGQPLAEAYLPYGSRTLTGNETTVVFGAQTMVHARIRIDESRTPIAVDYLNIGRGATTVTFGIMDLNGGVLRFCMAPAGAARPGEFTSDKGSGRILSKWKRK